METQLEIPKLPSYINRPQQFLKPEPGQPTPLVTKKHAHELLDKRGTNRVLQVISPVDMRCSHDGLRAVCLEKGGLDPHELKPGQYIVFLNAKKDHLKLYAAHNLVVSYKVPGGGRIDMRVIAQIPTFFNGSAINYDGAVEKMLEQYFARRGKKLETE